VRVLFSRLVGAVSVWFKMIVVWEECLVCLAALLVLAGVFGFGSPFWFLVLDCCCSCWGSVPCFCAELFCLFCGLVCFYLELLVLGMQFCFWGCIFMRLDEVFCFRVLQFWLWIVFVCFRVECLVFV